MFSKKMPLLLNFVFFAIIISVKAAEECKQSEYVSLDQAESECKQEAIQDRLITLLSLEGKEYQIPEKIAFQSKFIKAAYEGNEDQEIPTLIKSENLELLLQALSLMQQNQDKMILRKLHEFVWEIIFKNYDEQDEEDLQTLTDLFLDAIRLDSNALVNLIADFFGKLIENNHKILDSIIKVVRRQHLSLINKYYILRLHANYLRGDHNLDFGDKNLTKEIAKHMEISIEDLLGFVPGHIKVHLKVGNAEMPNQYELKLNNWRITSLKGIEKIKDIEKVETLNLSQNQIKSLEGLDSYLNNFSSLEDLLLSSNNIRIIPKDIFLGLNKLSYLDLSGNEIIDLDVKSFEGLSELEILGLNYNQLTNVEHVFDNLGKLHLLGLGDNLIESLGNSLHTLHNLRVIELKRNKIQDIDGSLDGLIKLKRIEIVDNPLNEQSMNILVGLKNKINGLKIDLFDEMDDEILVEELDLDIE